VRPPRRPTTDVPDEVREHKAQGDTIVAIKRLRELTDLGLAEAKPVVDSV
jgi:ribosomal protein L7/L12